MKILLASIFSFTAGLYAQAAFSPIGFNLGSYGFPGEETPVYGLRLNLGWVTYGGLRGIDLGWMSGTEGNVVGVQANAVCQSVFGNVTGVQLAGIYNAVGLDPISVTFYEQIHPLHLGEVNTHNGLQIAAGFNFNARINGIQLAGLCNAAHEVNGAQISLLYNISGSTVNGFQVGLINGAPDLRGLQVGVINFSLGSFKGLQLGLINISGGEYLAHKTGRSRVLPILNIGW